jgi:hypothetical protein
MKIKFLKTIQMTNVAVFNRITNDQGIDKNMQVVRLFKGMYTHFSFKAAGYESYHICLVNDDIPQVGDYFYSDNEIRKCVSRNENRIIDEVNKSFDFEDCIKIIASSYIVANLIRIDDITLDKITGIFKSVDEEIRVSVPLSPRCTKNDCINCVVCNSIEMVPVIERGFIKINVPERSSD